MSDKKERYIPSIRTINKAAESLPPVETWRGETFQVPIKKDRVIEFRKIKFKSNDRKRDCWIYDGKLMIQ